MIKSILIILFLTLIAQPSITAAEKCQSRLYKIKKESHYNAAGILIYYFINDYDQKGNLTQQQRYDSNILKLTINNNYNDEGKIKKSSYFNADNQLVYYDHYVYKDNGLLFKKLTYTLQPTLNLKYYFKFSYNSRHKLVKEELFQVQNNQHRVFLYSIYNYNTIGKLSAKKEYRAPQLLLNTVTYKYDSKNQLILEKHRNAAIQDKNPIIRYKYRNGLLIKLTTKNDSTVTYRTHFKYDSNNNLIQKSLYKSNSNNSNNPKKLSYRVTYQYIRIK